MAAPVELRVTITPEDADLISDALWGADPSAIEQRSADGGHLTLVAGFAHRVQAERATVMVAGVAASRHYDARDVEIVEVVDESWLDRWRETARPCRSGRFVIVPAWLAEADPAHSAHDAHDADADAVVISIDPGRAFGSGSHPTTRLMLRVVDDDVVFGSSVLDVGCGSGVLAVAAASIGASPVVAVDIDPVAVSATEANARANGMAAQVSASLDPVGAVDAPFDLVLANLAASTIAELADDLADRVAPGGRLVLSGLLADRWRPTAERFAGWSVTTVAEDDGWVALTLAKHRSHDSTPDERFGDA